MASLPPPDLNIPASSSTVNVSIIDTTTRIRGLPMAYFASPSVEGHTYIGAPAYAFLIQHPAQKRTLVFDLGVRKNWRESKVMLSRFEKSNVDFQIDNSVREILDAGGVDTSKIESVIWSHWHFDHTGDLPEFEPSTSLIVGPGFKGKLLPPNATDNQALELEGQVSGRELIELDFESSSLRIGQMQAIDYFGDQSFFFLNTPGHAVGHLCALARVTADPSSFILLGGDAYHHGGMLRPSSYLPLPTSITPHPFTPSLSTPCPGEIFEHLLKDNDKSTAFYVPATGGAYDDAEESLRTIQKLQEADAQQEILMVAAHDETLLDIVDFFPKTANDFVKKGWVQKARWRFLSDFATAVGFEGAVEGKREWGPKEG